MTNNPVEGWSEQELAAIRELGAEKDLSDMQVLRCALRHYQRTEHLLKAGETCTWSGDAQRAADFAGPLATLSNPVELQDAIERVALLPCPFCGQSGPTKLGYLPDSSGLNHGVRCVCGAVMRYGDKESTIKAWNTRAALSVSGDMREALEPFAKQADYADAVEADDDDYLDCPPLKAGDYRRARSILEGADQLLQQAISEGGSHGRNETT